MGRYFAMNPLVTHRSEWVPKVKKNGKPGLRMEYLFFPFCPLYECAVCPRRGSARRIQYRSGLGKFLCMSCWNRLRPIERAQRAVDELGYLQRKLLRTRHVNEHR